MTKAIKENEGIHITGLAEKLKVTKGAYNNPLKFHQDINQIMVNESLDNIGGSNYD